MADKSNIEWTDSTFNPWEGCTKVGPGCDNCYAETRNNRFGGGNWGPGAPRNRHSDAYWRKAIKWNNKQFFQCDDCGWRGDALEWVQCESSDDPQCPSCKGLFVSEARRRVFCASLADVFDNEVDPQWRADLFYLIYITPELDWLLLTKRIGNAGAMIEQAKIDAGLTTANAQQPWPNIWLGATVVNQEESDRDIPKLLAVPARVRFLSIEPMLGPIDIYNGDPDPRLGEYDHGVSALGEWWEPGDDLHGPPRRGVDWVICGGESGANARPMNPDWARSLRDQCEVTDTPFLFKQWGEWAPNWFVGDDGKKDGPEWMDRMGKKVAGRTLDGRTWDGFPEPRQ